MLNFITTLDNPLLDYIRDDPVRPEITREFRVGRGRMVAALVNEGAPDAVVCVSFHNSIPENVEGLSQTTQEPTVVVFYSVWSYKPGAGRDILLQSMLRIKETYPTITTYVTLSPPTEMARRFHLKNGATIYRTNKDTVNYLYS
jgi:hypothetical protein